VPDRFYGGLVGAFAAAVAGAVVSGFVLPTPGIPPHNPPGLIQTLWSVPGCLLALALLWVYGSHREGQQYGGTAE
jgi:hypothetical protein